MGGRDSAPQIRPAAAGDARRIAEIHVRGWHAAYRSLLPDALLRSLSVDDREADWRRAVERADVDPQLRLWVADGDGGVVGFVMTGPSRDDDAPAATGEVYAIYVEPALIGSGLGRRLFARAVTTLAAQGFTRATLWVLESNAASRRFYEAAGWRAEGGRKIERRRGVELVEALYARALSATPPGDPGGPSSGTSAGGARPR